MFRTLFSLPVERWIAWARVGLATVAMAVAIAEPVETEGSFANVKDILAAYLVLAALIVIAVSAQPYSRLIQYPVHGLDIAVSSALMYLTEGPTSPFFIFFIFITVSAALRWGWRGSIITGFGLAGILVAPLFTGELLESDEVRRTLVRAAFLVICASLLAYVEAFQERTRARLVHLADWPAVVPGEGGEQPLAALFRHASEVLAAPRVLLIWEQADEPRRHIALWSDGGLRESQERGDLFGELVAATHRDASFVVDVTQPFRGGRTRAHLIDPDLQRTFAIKSAVTAPFRRPQCSGRLFILDREQWSENDVPLTTIVAARIGIELEESLLRSELEEVAAGRERVRLARDLHDGVLQGLAAASIQLKISADQMPSGVKSTLDGVRDLLAEEARRIRSFVEETRSTGAPVTGIMPLAPEIEKRVDGLRRQWDCTINLKLQPPNMEASVSRAREIGHLISEAVSNAIRHGSACEVQIEIHQTSDQLEIRVLDNGSGFDNLSGSELTLMPGPLSLRSRVDELGGTLFLSSSHSGTDITIHLPP